MSDSSPTPGITLKPGDYHPPSPDDARGPCPIVNAFANHGYIPRDGRNITMDHFRAGFKALGIDLIITELLIRGSYVEHEETPDPPDEGQCPVTLPPPKPPYRVAYTCSHGGGPNSGLRPKGQVNSDGIPILHLDQIGRHNAVEHDISLSRRDYAQGDQISPQPDLIADFLASSSDGKVLTVADLGKFRKERYAQQIRDNPCVKFDANNNQMACGEVGLLQGVFSRGWKWSIPVEYMKALFEEERFPFNEGWKKRWFPVTLPEMFALMEIMKRYSTIDPEKGKKTS